MFKPGRTWGRKKKSGKYWDLETKKKGGGDDYEILCILTKECLFYLSCLLPVFNIHRGRIEDKQPHELGKVPTECLAALFLCSTVTKPDDANQW